jgi:universal stress protein A
MNVKRILFPFDFSDVGREALPLAISLARDSGAVLSVVYVHERPVELLSEEGIPVTGQEMDPTALTNQLREAIPADPGATCEYHVLSGSPASEIVRFAKQTNADLIVMSTHGRRGLSHLLMGSVAEAVVRNAPCPVLTHRAARQE